VYIWMEYRRSIQRCLRICEARWSRDESTSIRDIPGFKNHFQDMIHGNTASVMVEKPFQLGLHGFELNQAPEIHTRYISITSAQDWIGFRH
jgi:hypothetical protein